MQSKAEHGLQKNTEVRTVRKKTRQTGMIQMRPVVTDRENLSRRVVREGEKLETQSKDECKQKNHDKNSILISVELKNSEIEHELAASNF